MFLSQFFFENSVFDRLINCVVCRLGFVIDFLSKATLVGFMAGAAVIVALQQLKGLLGISHFTSKMQMNAVLSSVFTHKDEVESLISLEQYYHFKTMVSCSNVYNAGFLHLQSWLLIFL